MTRPSLSKCIGWMPVAPGEPEEDHDDPLFADDDSEEEMDDRLDDEARCGDQPREPAVTLSDDEEALVEFLADTFPEAQYLGGGFFIAYVSTDVNEIMGLAIEAGAETLRLVVLGNDDLCHAYISINMDSKVVISSEGWSPGQWVVESIKNVPNRRHIAHAILAFVGNETYGAQWTDEIRSAWNATFVYPLATDIDLSQVQLSADAHVALDIYTRAAQERRAAAEKLNDISSRWTYEQRKVIATTPYNMLQAMAGFEALTSDECSYIRRYAAGETPAEIMERLDRLRIQP